MFFTGANRIESSPAITADGLVLIGSHSGRFQAIHSITGLKVWEHKTNNNFDAPGIVGPDGTIFVGNNSDKIYALNPSTGEKVWEFATRKHINERRLSGQTVSCM